MQIVSGFVIGLFPTGPDGAYALDAYRLVFGLQARLSYWFRWFICVPAIPESSGARRKAQPCADTHRK